MGGTRLVQTTMPASPSINGDAVGSARRSCAASRLRGLRALVGARPLPCAALDEITSAAGPPDIGRMNIASHGRCGNWIRAANRLFFHFLKLLIDPAPTRSSARTCDSHYVPIGCRKTHHCRPGC